MIVIYCSDFLNIVHVPTVFYLLSRNRHPSIIIMKKFHLHCKFYRCGLVHVRTRNLYSFWFPGIRCDIMICRSVEFSSELFRKKSRADFHGVLEKLLKLGVFIEESIVLRTVAVYIR